MKDRRVPVLVAMFAAVAVALVACSDDGETPTPTQAAPTQAVATPFSPPYVEATPTPLPSPQVVGPPLVEVTGLFTEPREAPQTVSRPLGPRPASTFMSWDGNTTVLYDVVAGTETNLGPGSVGRFSPDSTRMAWIRGASDHGEAMLLDLHMMQQESLGTARLVMWGDNDTVSLTVGNTSEIRNLRTGERTSVEGIPFSPDFNITTTPDGRYELRREDLSDDQHPASTWYLTDPSTDSLLLKLDAYRAVPAGPGWVAVATAIQDAGSPGPGGFRPGTTNVFLVDIASGAATFIATSPWVYANWPLVANDRYVAWTDAYCGQPQGTTKLYDRTTGQIFDLGQPLWLDDFTRDGLLAEGGFGAKALIDLDTMTYRAVLPGGELHWSPDWRFASVGRVGGHGGLCP